MSKLPSENKFVDLSDYGRPFARLIANNLKDTKVTPVQVTIWFIFAGLAAIYCIFTHNYILAGFFLVLKSILDAADGELSRVKQTPSYIGRYLDSIADIVLNFLFLAAIGLVLNTNFLWIILAFIGLQLQGTLYNYYYVILRNKFDGDTTSRIFETEPPEAMFGESQETVNTYFHIYNFCYIIFDKSIYYLDRSAVKNAHLPSWFMTMISIFGLGFQLLLMAILINISAIHLVIPIFIGLTMTIPLIVLLRKLIS
jgi:hypothetical protein